MGALMRSLDWSRTAVGPVEIWPQSLRTALSILLETGFPMYIAWGQDYTQFYNDGYRPILGSTKHPAAMGISTRETFAEIWEIIGPMFAGVMEGRATTVVDFMLPLDRHGFTEECYFIFSYSPIREEAGRVGGVLVTVTETTQRVLGERRLKTTQALAAETRNARTVTEACEIAGRVLAGNVADLPFARMYLIGANQDGATLVAACGVDGPGTELPHTIRLGAEPISAVMRTGRLQVLDDVAGTPRAGRLLALPITRHGGGEALGILIARTSPRLLLDDPYRDFLALVASQIGTAIAGAQALVEAQTRADALAALDRAKTAFFSNVSHEFRTPLTLMLGPTEEALASPERALVGEDLETVHRNALRLLKLVNTLLEFSRLEAGRVTAMFESTDLAALTADLASAFRSATERAGVQLTVTCPALPEPVFVDREMWEKIVLNLLSNALKFTFHGSIAVELAADERDVELRVRDTGIGIAPEDIDRVFDRFHRVERSAARTHEGSGIGLALVRELVGIHGGSIRVSSSPGTGSVFFVRVPFGIAHLPRDRVKTGEPAGPPAAGAGAAPYVEEALRWLPDGPGPTLESPGLAASASAARILIADDNTDMRDYLTRLLSSHYQVESVRDGTTALEAVRRNRPDVIVSDVMMPGLDGFQLVAAVRRDPATRGIPIMLLSARAGEEARIDGFHAGADDYLVKPFSAREFLVRVAAQLERAKIRALEEEQAIQLTDARREAEAANRAKDEFLAMLGHELRNPLAPILTALQLMRLRNLDGAERERSIIERQVKHLVSLVDDLLDVSRITRGKVQLKRVRLDLADIIAKAIEMASPAIEERRHVLNVTVARPLVVDGDPGRLSQVVANLLTNAAKYTDPGGRIEVEGGAEDLMAVVSVTDSGRGISPEMLPRIFDMFSQERQEIDRSEGGLGLGLAIVRSLVQSHGGTVSASSDGKGLGSRFTIRLPLAIGSGDDTAAAGVPLLVLASANSGLRVLVVDDNPDAAEMLAESLRMLGHTTSVAFNGASAIEAAGAFRPDVALLDLGLPVMDGFEVAHRLQVMPGLERLTMVAITGYGQEFDRQRTREAGFHEHMVKPVDLDLLEDWLRRQRSPGR